MKRRTIPALVLATLLALAASALAQAVAPVVQVRVDPPLGHFLTDDAGMTLYVFSRDESGVSNCNGGCASNWQPLVGGFDPAGIQPALGEGASGEVTLFARADGGAQVVLAGTPLYYWRNDFVPGDVTGDGVGGNWDLARP